MKRAIPALTILTVFVIAATLLMTGGDVSEAPPSVTAWPEPTVMVEELVEQHPPRISGYSTATPTPSPTVIPIAPLVTKTPESVTAVPFTLSPDDFRILARTVGFVRAHVIEEALRVACGGGSTRWGESGCQPSARNGPYIGLFQIHEDWAEFCGVDAWTLAYPAVNLACARIILHYEEANGLPRWSHWEVRPD